MIVLLSSILFVGCDGYSLDIDKYLDEKYESFRVLATVGIDMSSDYQQEYVAFLEDPELSEMDSGERPPIAKVIVVMANTEKDLIEYNLKAGSLGFVDWTIDVIRSLSTKYGEWNGYCYVHDIDGDGYDELITFHLSTGFGKAIWKYEDETIEMIESIDLSDMAIEYNN